MPSEKKIKEELKKKAFKEPEKYYPISVFNDLGLTRKHCKCGVYFWSKGKDPICGNCEGYQFIDNPIGKKMNFIQVWKEFSRIMKKLGYIPIARYPVVARWRDDIEFVHAAVNNFQPQVVKGEVKPPANPLIQTQPCLRFKEISNVGITGRHNTVHMHMEQFAIQSKDKFNQEKYLKDIIIWLVKGAEIPLEEIKFHEDAWGGGGNLGVSLEYFARGLELGNQVYMTYEILPDGTYTELENKVLDMGSGQDRYAWVASGKPTIYDVDYPKVLAKIRKITGVKITPLYKEFVKNANILNIDEVKNIEIAWREVAKKLKIPSEKLKEEVSLNAALYSIADHTQCLLFALADGALPSNVGGGYNLRLIYRRAYDFIKQYNWKLSISEICKWHAEELKPQYPELIKAIPEVEKILEVEEQKYKETLRRTKIFIKSLKERNEKLTEEKLLEIYDSQSITPDILVKEGLIKKVPSDFYSKVAGLHEKKEQKAATEKEKKLNLEGISETELLFYKNEKQKEFSAKVLKTTNNKIILNKTLFYATSGGQLHDIGYINKQKVIEVFKQGNIIVHVIGDKPKFKKNDKVKGEIDWSRRLQLMQHHTATHIINAAARKILGNHINQAGALKEAEKARLDITHYQNLTNEELKKIEQEANRIVKKKIPIIKTFIPRNEAEKKYGFTIYQGPAVPSRELRIVNIKGVDVECCGGTHLDNTSEVSQIKILRSTKISDSIIRLEYVAGKKASEEENKELNLLKETAKILNVKLEQIPSRAEELFAKWKKARKAIKKGRKIKAEELELKIKKTERLSPEELLKKTALIFKTQIEHVPKTATRFLKELKEFKKKI